MQPIKLCLWVEHQVEMRAAPEANIIIRSSQPHSCIAVSPLRSLHAAISSFARSTVSMLGIDQWIVLTPIALNVQHQCQYQCQCPSHLLTLIHTGIYSPCSLMSLAPPPASPPIPRKADSMSCAILFGYPCPGRLVVGMVVATCESVWLGGQMQLPSCTVDGA